MTRWESCLRPERGAGLQGTMLVRSLRWPRPPSLTRSLYSAPPCRSGSAPVDGIRRLDDAGSDLASIDVPTPLCQREGTHVECLGAVLSWRQQVLNSIDAVGNAFQRADDGPSAKDLKVCQPPVLFVHGPRCTTRSVRQRLIDPRPPAGLQREVTWMLDDTVAVRCSVVVHVATRLTRSAGWQCSHLHSQPIAGLTLPHHACACRPSGRPRTALGCLNPGSSCSWRPGWRRGAAATRLHGRWPCERRCQSCSTCASGGCRCAAVLGRHPDREDLAGHARGGAPTAPCTTLSRQRTMPQPLVPPRTGTGAFPVPHRSRPLARSGAGSGPRRADPAP